MTQIPAGWYPDPAPTQHPTVPPGLRYWDGVQWTEHVAPRPQQPVGVATAGGPVKTTPDGEVLAGWWSRVGAYVLDGLITGAIGAVVGLPFLITYLREYSAAMEESFARAEAGGAAPDFLAGYQVGWESLLGLTLVGLVVTVAYHATFLRWKSRTPGKMALGLRVRLRERPGQLPWSAIGLRLLVQNVASLFAAVPFASLLVGWFPLLDGLWPLWDDKNQALHDKAARTNVVVDRRQA